MATYGIPSARQFTLADLQFGQGNGTGLFLPGQTQQQQDIVPPNLQGNNNGATPIGPNIGTLGTAFSGMQALANLYGAFQGQKLARQQFDFTKDVTNTNLANQIKSYNTALEDRINSRAAYQGLSQDQVRDYLDRNSMSRS